MESFLKQDKNLCLFLIVNTMGADVLVTLGVRASAIMIFTMLNESTRSPHDNGFNDFDQSVCI